MIEFWDHSLSGLKGRCEKLVREAVAAAAVELNLDLDWRWICINDIGAIDTRLKKLAELHPGSKDLLVYAHFQTDDAPFWRDTGRLPADFPWLGFSYRGVYSREFARAGGIDNLVSLAKDQNGVKNLARDLAKHWRLKAR